MAAVGQTKAEKHLISGSVPALHNKWLLSPFITFEHWQVNGTWRKFINGVEILDPWDGDNLLEPPVNGLGTNKLMCLKENENEE